MAEATRRGHRQPLAATVGTTAPSGGQAGRPLTGHTNDIRAVALGTLGGVPVALTGSDDETARLWDLRTSRQSGATLTGHTEWVRSVALDQLDSTAIAITAGDDDTARVRNLRTGESRVLSGHTGDVKGVATVRVGTGTSPSPPPPTAPPGCGTCVRASSPADRSPVTTARCGAWRRGRSAARPSRSPPATTGRCASGTWRRASRSARR
ncbi:hypothetical protein ACFQ0B_69825 [Nonomuraea thailandensis]